MTLIQYTFAFFLVLTFSQLAPSISVGITLCLIPLLSPKSPLYPGNLSHSQRIQKMVEISEARVEYLTSTLSHNDDMHSQNTFHHIRFYSYFVEISLGLPKHSHTLAVDAGTGLIWAQCKPCINCYNQTVPIFDPRTSTSYRKLSVNDPRCKWPIFRNENGEYCSYDLKNPGESRTIGIASTETFTFPSNKGQGLITLSNIVFGCSNESTRMPFSGTKISGVLGLNMATSSLGNQLRGKIQGSSSSRFTYCLNPFSLGEQDGTSLLQFGYDAVFAKGKEYQTTPVIVNKFDDYLLNLEDISVGNQRIRFPHGTFARGNNNYTGGAFLDFGSIFTFMQSAPYKIVMEKFDEYFISAGRERVSPPPETEDKFEYCYNYDDNFRGGLVPMTYHFRGPAQLQIKPSQLYIVIRDVFCVTIVSSKDFTGVEFTVIGALHQQNNRFIFDLDKHLIQFAPEDCSLDNKK